MRNIPGQNDAGEDHGLIQGIPFLDHQHQSVDTERGGQPSGRQHARHPQLLVARHLQRPSHGQGQDQDNQIRHDTNDRIGHQGRPLVQTLGFDVQVPVSGDRVTHADLDDQGDDVVHTEAPEEGVDEDDFGFEGGEDARQDGEQSDLAQERHRTVQDGGDVTELYVPEVSRVIYFWLSEALKDAFKDIPCGKESDHPKERL